MQGRYLALMGLLVAFATITIVGATTGSSPRTPWRARSSSAAWQRSGRREGGVDMLLEFKIDVNASPDEVFAYVADVAKHADWANPTLVMQSSYLGDAIIMQVDLNASAGRVTLQKDKIVPNEAEVIAGGQP